MNFREALKLMLDGKKIRDSDWEKNHFIYFKENMIRDEKGFLYELNTVNYGSDKWEEYQEPQAEIKFPRFMIHKNTGMIVLFFNKYSCIPICGVDKNIDYGYPYIEKMEEYIELKGVYFSQEKDKTITVSVVETC